ncbi:MAG: HNH endonuclease [Candidatus Zixiibacteriota bacterium]
MRFSPPGAQGARKRRVRQGNLPYINLNAIRQATTDAVVVRQLRQFNALQRNRASATALKALYENRCVFCDMRLQVGTDPTEYYSQAAHIKPLGKPHDGPDKLGNMLILCPNHHLQFDRGLLRIEIRSGGFYIASRVDSDPLNGKPIHLHPEHALDADCVRWHFEWFDYNE